MFCAGVLLLNYSVVYESLTAGKREVHPSAHYDQYQGIYKPLWESLQLRNRRAFSIVTNPSLRNTLFHSLFGLTPNDFPWLTEFAAFR